MKMKIDKWQENQTNDMRAEQKINKYKVRTNNMNKAVETERNATCTT